MYLAWCEENLLPPAPPPPKVLQWMVFAPQLAPGRFIQNWLSLCECNSFPAYVHDDVKMHMMQCPLPFEQLHVDFMILPCRTDRYL